MKIFPEGGRMGHMHNACARRTTEGVIGTNADVRGTARGEGTVDPALVGLCASTPKEG